MMGPEFAKQMQRLQTRFGPKAFDAEFVDLVWREVKDMGEQAFTRFVDVMIGSRAPTKPPLLSEFREARLAEHKRSFDNEVRGAARTMAKPITEVLRPAFGGVASVKEAFEIARLRLRTGGKS